MTAVKDKKRKVSSHTNMVKLPFHKPLKRNYSAITSFEVIKPQHELETVGEILHLSFFGEYCPDASLRGYQLEELLMKPAHYRPKTIVQRGEVIELNYEK